MLLSIFATVSLRQAQVTGGGAAVRLALTALLVLLTVVPATPSAAEPPAKARVELVKLPVDLIVTSGNTSTASAQKATRTIPVVFSTSDPVGCGFLASLARPGGTAKALGSTFSPQVLSRADEVIK